MAAEKPTFSEEDILLVQQQANVSREKAVASLEESRWRGRKGELLEAHLLTTSSGPGCCRTDLAKTPGTLALRLPL